MCCIWFFYYSQIAFCDVKDNIIHSHKMEMTLNAPIDPVNAPVALTPCTLTENVAETTLQIRRIARIRGHIAAREQQAGDRSYLCTPKREVEKERPSTFKQKSKTIISLLVLYFLRKHHHLTNSADLGACVLALRDEQEDELTESIMMIRVARGPSTLDIYISWIHQAFGLTSYTSHFQQCCTTMSLREKTVLSCAQIYLATLTLNAGSVLCSLDMSTFTFTTCIKVVYSS
jgi:hypothetical protein